MKPDETALPVSRRQFLGTAAAMTLAAQGAAIAAETGSRPIRVGFLGLAYSHTAEKCRILKESAGWDLVGAWAETPALAREYAGRGIRILTQAEVLERAEVVLVESEVAQHAPLARLALEAGRHVHLEKPPSLRLDDFDALLRLAREGKRLLQVGYMWRHHPGLNAVQELIRSGGLGDVYLVRIAIDNQLAAERRAEWAQFPGGVLFELGSHVIDTAVRFFGRPERVTPFLRTLGGNGTDRLADANVAVLEFGRTTVVITCSSLRHNAGANRSFEFCGTRGNALLQPIEPPNLTLDLAQVSGTYSAGRSTVTLPVYRRYVNELAELADCVRHSRPLPVPLDLERTVQETLLRSVGIH